MITYIEYGNIFALPGVSNYAHGCNCAGAMGKGIALQFREKFPEMYLQYKKLCKEKLFTPGDLFAYPYGDGVIFNLGTQKTWKTGAEESAIENALTKMLLYATDNNTTKISMPRIGAGLGGLNWDSVKTLLNRVAENYPLIYIYVVENYRE